MWTEYPGPRLHSFFISVGLYLHLIHLFTHMKLLWSSPLPAISFTFEILNLNILLLTLIFYPFTNLFINAFEICSSWTPLSIKCCVYKQARIQCPSPHTYVRLLSFCALLDFYHMHLAEPRFSISLSLEYTKGVCWTLMERNHNHHPEFPVSSPCISWLGHRAIPSFSIGAILNILCFL